MQFYILIENDWKTRKQVPDNNFLSDEPTNFGKVIHCPQCQTGDRKDWLPPYYVEIEIYRKSIFAEVILGTCDVSIVAERFKTCYEQTDLKGLGFRGSVTVSKVTCMWGARKKLLPKIPCYYMTDIKRGTTAADHQKSGSVFLINGEPTCNYCRTGDIMRIKQLVIDESTWDGSDIFLLNGIYSIITTEKFKEWYETNNFTGSKLIPVETYHFDLYDGKTPEEYLQSTQTL